MSDLGWWLCAIPEPPFGAARAEAACDSVSEFAAALRVLFYTRACAERVARQVAAGNRPRQHMGGDAALRVRACRRALEMVARLRSGEEPALDLGTAAAVIQHEPLYAVGLAEMSRDARRWLENP